MRARGQGRGRRGSRTQPRRPTAARPPRRRRARRPRAPTASTRPRSCATSTRARRGAWPAAGCCASGSWSPTTRRSRSRPGVKFAGLDLQRPRARARPCAAREGERLRIRFVNGSAAPAHDPLPRHPPARAWTACPGIGAGQRSSPASTSVYEFDAEPFGLHLYHCHVVAAGRAHRQGPLRRLHHRPASDGPRRRRRAGDGDERLRHQLRPRQRGLRRQHGRLPLHRTSRSGSSAASWCGSTWSTSSSSTRSTRSTSTPTSSTTTRPARRSSRPSSPTRSCRARAQRGILELRFPYAGQVHVPRPQSEFAELGWMGFFEVGATDGGRAAGRARRRLAAAVPGLGCSGSRPACADRGRDRRSSRCSAGPGSASAPAPPVEELAVERTVLQPGRDRADRPQRRPGPGRGRPGRSVNDAYVAVHRERRTHDRPARRRRRSTIAYPWIEGEAYEVSLLTSTGATIDARDRRRGRDARRRPRLLRADGAARHLRRRDPGRARDAVAAVRAPRSTPRWMRVLIALTSGCSPSSPSTRRSRARDRRRRAPQALRRRGAGLPRRRASPTWRSSGVDALAARAPEPRRAAGAGGGYAGAAGRDRDRAAQPRRGTGDRLRVRGRRARARRLPGGRLRASTTPPRASRSSRRWPRARRASRASALLGLIAGAPGDRSARGSARRPSTRASPRFLLGVGVGAIAQVIEQLVPAIRDGAGRVLNRGASPGCSPALRRPVRDRPAGERLMAGARHRASRTPWPRTTRRRSTRSRSASDEPVSAPPRSPSGSASRRPRRRRWSRGSTSSGWSSTSPTTASS